MGAVSVPWLLASSSETLVLLKASLRGPDFESQKRARFGGRKTAPLFVNFFYKLRRVFCNILGPEIGLSFLIGKIYHRRIQL